MVGCRAYRKKGRRGSELAGRVTEGRERERIAKQRKAPIMLSNWPELTCPPLVLIYTQMVESRVAYSGICVFIFSDTERAFKT